MEMPVDILTRRFGRLVDAGAMVGDYTATAIDIDEELQEKFIFIPQEEIDAVEIDDHPDNTRFELQAGSGPETIRANEHDNPAWLYNSAVHALAMYQHLQKLEKERAAEFERMAKRPEPGVYQGTYNGNVHFTVVVTEDKRIMIPQSTGGLMDQSVKWDTAIDEGSRLWTLRRVDIADGTIADG